MEHVSVPSGWMAESEFWRGSYRTRPYARADRDYDYYEPAYRYGFESADLHHGKAWGDVESDLERGWDSYKLRGHLAWMDIKEAVRDAWDRVTTRRPR